MPDLEAPAWLRSWIITGLNSTVYASVGVSVGAILYLIAPSFGGQPWSWFFAGTCIPPGLMALVNTSDWMFYRRLRNLKKLFDDGLISQELYEQDRRRAMDWRADRLYGKPSASSSLKPATKKRAKPAIASKEAEKPPAAAPQAEVQPEASRLTTSE